jgi:beta-keto acid cleavage enzyme
MVNTPAMLRAMAGRIQELGVRPELEVFDTGHLVLVEHLIRDGLIDDPALIQLCMGIPYGAPDDPGTLLALVGRLPPGAVFSAFSIGRMQLPYVALAALARREGDQRAARRARGDDPRGDGSPRARAGRGAGAAAARPPWLSGSGCSAAA